MLEENALNEANAMINQPILMGAIDKILIKRSIAKRVSDIQPLKGPVGIITGAKWDEATDKLKIAKADITAATKKVRTEFTIEALQDMKGIYDESFYEVLAHYLVDNMAYQIDAEFITKVVAQAVPKTNLSFDNTYDKDLRGVGYAIAISIMKGLSDLPISDNRSPNGWAIVSSDVAAVLALTTSLENDGTDDSPSYLGKLAGVDFYIDYTNDNSGVDSVVFGIKGNGLSKGSTIFSPYRNDWIETVDASSGEPVFFLLHRSAVSINPLDKEYFDAGASGFLGKFDVSFSGLSVFA